MWGEWVRVELSLRPAKKGGAAVSAAAAAASVAEIPLGAVLPGVVRRVEAFGVFVEVPPPSCQPCIPLWSVPAVHSL